VVSFIEARVVGSGRRDRQQSQMRRNRRHRRRGIRLQTDRTSDVFETCLQAEPEISIQRSETQIHSFVGAGMAVDSSILAFGGDRRFGPAPPKG